MDTPLARSTDSHGVMSRRQRCTVSGKLLSLRGVQVTGDAVEMDRLRENAEEAIANGVCGSLALAHSSAQQTVCTLGHEDNMLDPFAAKATQLREAATDWVTVIDSMIVDYLCQ